MRVKVIPVFILFFTLVFHKEIEYLQIAQNCTIRESLFLYKMAKLFVPVDYFCPVFTLYSFLFPKLI